MKSFIKTSLLRYFLTIWGFALLLSVASCTRVSVETSYYLIDYRPLPTNPKLKLKQPLPYRAQVLTFKIPRSYDSIRIIARLSTHQISYYRYSLWAVRPQVAIADLLVQHLKVYRIFQQTEREFLNERPNYEITGAIDQIEIFASEQYTAAHLKGRMECYEYETAELKVIHDFNTEIQIPEGNITMFAKAISDIIHMEAELFFDKIIISLAPQDTTKSDTTAIKKPSEIKREN